MKELNLNTKLKVKLSEEGIKQIREEYKELLSYNPELINLLIKDVDENGYREYSILELMNLFDGMFNKSIVKAQTLFESDVLLSENDLKECSLCLK